MAHKVATATGAWSAAATWNSVTNTPTLHATTNQTVNTSLRYTATFTAPNTTNACTGVLLPVVATGTGDWTVTLQENSIDTAATVTVTNANLTTSAWEYFQFATPYVFTATTAGYYRFKVVSSASGGTCAADSGGSLFAYLATDDRTGVPATTDDVWICGPNSTTLTVTVDGTQACGSGSETVLVLQRSILNAITISKGGILAADTAASCTLTYKGNICINYGGELQAGTTATCYPTGQIARFAATMTTSGDHGIRVWPGGRFIAQGEPKTSTTLWKAMYVSGVGTAASPLVVDASVDWAVNDEIIITSTGTSATNYQESENKFIKTKVSATTFVLSDTAGGAESAFTYTHTTDAYVLNVQRNVVFDTTDITKSFYLYAGSTTSGDVDIDWVRFETAGNLTTNKDAIRFAAVTGGYGACDYSVSYRSLYYGFYVSSTKLAATYNGLIACNSTTTAGTGGLYLNSTVNQTFNDYFAVKNLRLGLVSTASTCTFNRGVFNSNNTSGTALTSASGAIYILNGSALTLNNCEIQANRSAGITLNGSYGTEFASCNIGTLGTNAVDVNCIVDSLNSTLFTGCNFGSATLLNGYLIQSAGSDISFHRLNADNTHYWYTNTGSGQSTGAALADTTVRTPGSLGLRLAPEDATDGITWSFNIYAKSNSIVNFFGYFQKNTAFGTSVARVELWLPGSTTADTKVTLSNTTGVWQSASLSANYTGSVDALATIKVVGITATAAAYLYCDDFYNAGDTTSNSDKVTGLDTWDRGKPVTIIAPQATSPADIWTFSTTYLTTADTTGKALVDAKNNAALIPAIL